MSTCVCDCQRYIIFKKSHGLAFTEPNRFFIPFLSLCFYYGLCWLDFFPLLFSLVSCICQVGREERLVKVAWTSWSYSMAYFLQKPERQRENVSLFFASTQGMITIARCDLAGVLYTDMTIIWLLKILSKLIFSLKRKEVVKVGLLRRNKALSQENISYALFFFEKVFEKLVDGIKNDRVTPTETERKYSG